jgi:hypothetical protein
MRIDIIFVQLSMSERTFGGIALGAEYHLNWPSSNPPVYHTLSHLSQSWTSIELSSVVPIGILSS